MRIPSKEVQRDVIEAIRRLKKDAEVWPPTMREIGEEAGRHYSSVFWVIRELAKVGIVTYKPGAFRSLRILKQLPRSKSVSAEAR